jgi:hypothetical protein
VFSRVKNTPSSPPHSAGFLFLLPRIPRLLANNLSLCTILRFSATVGNCVAYPQSYIHLQLPIIIMASQGGIDRLRAATIDGRTDNVRYRQNQLQSLHATLRNNVEKILSAISEDVGSSHLQDNNSEASCEFYLASNAIRRLYESLDFKQSLKDEYQVANGADYLTRRVGKGLVVIRPTAHTRFYSIICPLATAITAGNCVCLEVSKDRHLFNFERHALTYCRH